MILLSLRNRLPSLSLRHRSLSTSSHLANNSLPSSSLPSPDHATLSPQALLSHYSQKRAQPVTYADLKQYGSPPLEEAKLLESGERTRGLLLSGLSRRVMDHLSLPFLPATNPSLQSIYNLYSEAFTAMAQVPPITTLQDNAQLCKAMAKMVEQHRDNIPILAKGFQESRRYLADDRITAFLDRAIKNRISLRLIAEQHLSLSDASTPFLTSSSSSSSSSSSPTPTLPLSASKTNRIGVLDLELNPTKMVASCASFVTSLCDATYGVSPTYKIEGLTSTIPVGVISVHLDYILTELLKNAFRATVEHHSPALLKQSRSEEEEEEGEEGAFKFMDLPMAHLESSDFPPVVISIGVVPGCLTIRIRDRGGGIAPENLSNVFSYAFTTVPRLADPDSDPDSPASFSFTSLDDHATGYYGGGGDGNGGESSLKTELGTLAGLGFGLPLSRLYATYFGGSLDLVSMYGWGTDVYIVLRTTSLGSN